MNEKGHKGDQEFRAPPGKKIQEFVTDPDSAKEMVDSARGMGKFLADKKVSTSQIRKIFGSLKSLEMKEWGSSRKALDPYVQRRLVLVKPQLAYSEGRTDKDEKKGLHELRRMLESGIDAVQDRDSFFRFMELFEAVLAYHKAHGGK